MKLAPEYLALAVFAFAVILFFVSGEGCFRFEHQRFANFANPIYIITMFASLVSVAVGSFSLIWIVQTVNKDERT